MDIHIVSGHVDCEDTDILKPFADKAAAEAFVKECEAYDKTRPESPKLHIHSSKEEWAGSLTPWRVSFVAWVKNHPAGGEYYDSYDVTTLPLIEKD